MSCDKLKDDKCSHNTDFSPETRRKDKKPDLIVLSRRACGRTLSSFASISTTSVSTSSMPALWREDKHQMMAGFKQTRENHAKLKTIAVRSDPTLLLLRKI